MQNLTPRYNTRKQRSLSCFCMVRGYSSTRTYVTLWGRAVLGDRGGSSVRVRCACTNNRARESLIRVLYWSPLHLEDLLGDVVPEQLVSVAIRVQPRHGTAICVCRPAQEAHQTKYESDDAHSHILLGTGQRRAHPLQAERNWNGAVHNLRTSSAVSVSWPSLQRSTSAPPVPAPVRRRVPCFVCGPCHLYHRLRSSTLDCVNLSTHSGAEGGGRSVSALIFQTNPCARSQSKHTQHSSSREISLVFARGRPFVLLLLLPPPLLLLLAVGAPAAGTQE